MALEYKIDLSRLNVIELDKSFKISDVISIQEQREANSH